jgi:DNA-binding CsgD family transcriptional regulator
MNLDKNKWSKVVSAFSSAALGVGRWTEGLALLAEVTGSRSGQLIGLGDDHAVPFNFISDSDSEWLQDFKRADGGNPSVNPFVRAGTECSQNAVLSSADFFPKEQRSCNGFYQDCLVRYDFPYICLAPLHKAGSTLIGLSVLRSKKQGEITEPEKQIFTLFVPHIRAMVRTQIALENRSFRSMMEGLELSRICAFVCAPDGKVLEMTPEAMRYIESGNVLRIIAGKIASPCSRSTLALRSKILEISSKRNNAHDALESAIILGNDHDRCLLQISGIPHIESFWNFGNSSLIVVRRPFNVSGRAADILCTHYRLSTAEADVCLKLAEGIPIKRIASARGCSFETTRKQVKSAFEKLNIHRQCELVALVTQLQ